MPLRFHPEPVTLTGQRVELRPLVDACFEPLAAIANDESIWRWYPVSCQSREGLRAWLDAALAETEAGTSLPFATFDRTDGRIAGSTRFMNIDRTHRRVEIGNTWLAPAFQRSHVNTEAKYLMLRHAFETWGCNRVEFKTDSLNTRSRAALARIGAKEEGTLRNHMVTSSGRLRHSVYFSVTVEEWPQVKEDLEAKMSAARQAGADRT